ncbi:MAG: hypothetical protein RBS57_09400 [Desulforhabdus sp.]|jgi:hypothetical protein|nr:hypothetical protein [Desulforhabdus sp.]
MQADDIKKKILGNHGHFAVSVADFSTKPYHNYLELLLFLKGKVHTGGTNAIFGKKKPLSDEPSG